MKANRIIKATILTIARYLLAIVILVLSVMLFLIPGFKYVKDAPGLVFALMIMLTAWACGFGPGVFNTLIVALGSKPKDIESAQQQPLRFLLLVLTGVVLSAASHWLKMSRRRLKLHAESLKSVIDASVDHIYVLDQNGKFLQVGTTAAEFLERWPDDMVGKSWSELRLPTDVMQPLHEIRQNVLESGESQRGDIVSATKSGPRDFEYVVAPVRTMQGNLSQKVVIVGRDVTERRKADDSHARLAAIIENSDDAIISIGLDGLVRSWNSGAERLLGYPAYEMLGAPLDRIIPKERRGEEREFLDRLKDGERIEHFESVRLSKNGQALDVAITISPIRDAQGQIIGASKIIRDVTDRKRASDVNARLAAIVESSDDAVISEDLNGLIVSWNASSQRIFGYTAAEVVGRKSSSILVCPDRPSEPAELLERVKAGQAIRNFETRRSRKDGTSIDVTVTISVVRDQAGAPIGIARIHRDITERLKSERTRRETERLARSVLDSLSDLIAVIDETGEIIATNRAWREFSRQMGAVGPFADGAFAEGANYLTACESAIAAGREDARAFTIAINEMLEGRRDRFELEYDLHSETERRWFIGRLSPFQGEGPRRIVISHHNVTAKKLAEEHLRHRERVLAHSQKMAHVGSWEWDLRLQSDGRFTFEGLRWSEETYRIFGYEPNSVTVSSELVFNAVSNQDRRAIVSGVEHSLRQGQPFELETRIVRPNGTTRFIHVWAEPNPVVEHADHRVSLIGTCQDITQRKLAESALRESNEKLRLFVEHAPAAIAMLDTKMHYLAASRRWLTDFGPSTDDPFGKSHYDIFPDLPQRWKDVHARCLEGSIEHAEDDVIEWANGKRQSIRWEVHPWHADDGSVGGLIIFAEDISQRKLASESLRESNDRLAMATWAADLGTWDVDLVKGRIVWSDRQQELFGFTAETFDGNVESILARVHSDDLGPLRRSLAHARKVREPYRFEYRVVLPDGTMRWLADFGRHSYDEAGNPTRIVGVTQEITERKVAEEVLSKSRQQLVAVLESMTDGYLIADSHWQITYVHPRVEPFFDKSAKRLVGTNIWKAFPEFAGTSFERGCHRAVVEQTPVSIEDFYPSPVSKWLHVHAYPSNEELLIYFSDVSERHRAQEALRNYAVRLESLRAIDLAILAAQSPEEVAEATLQHLATLVICQTGAAMVVDEDRQKLIVLSALGHALEAQPKGTTIAFGEVVWPEFETLKEGRIVVADDLAGVSLAGTFMEPFNTAGLQSYALVPLTDRLKLIGVLMLGSDVANAFGNGAIEVIREVIDHLAIAIQQSLLHDEILRAKDRLEMMSRRLVMAEEAERRRIAHELHDETGQGLAALKINLHAAVQNPAAPSAARRLEESLGLVNRTIAQVRSLSVHLRPSLLDDYGLVVSLRSYCEGAALRLGIRIDFIADTGLGRCDAEVETACYRIVQEALNNVAKHAEASEVQVRLERRNEELILRIHDDGVGFNVNDAQDRAKAGSSFGVLGMQERAMLVGGRLTIESGDGLGTLIRAMLPFREALDAHVNGEAEG